MKESKDPFDQMILEDLEREADEIRRNVAAANLPPMTNEQKEKIRGNIQKEMDAREVQKIYEQLPEEYQEALKIGMETIEREKLESDKDKKKHKSRRKVYLARVAAAVVVVLLAGGIGVTSFGGPERVMEMMKRNVGSREVEQVDSNKDNLVIKEENEEEAYQKIKDELGIEPVRLAVRPKDFKFEEIKLDKKAQISEILYQYKGENILYTINMIQSNNSWGIYREDKEVKKYIKKVKGIDINIQEYILSKSKKKRYVAKFKYLGTGYYLAGVMPRDEFINLLKNLHFS